jgi:hypothetical protein
MSATSTRATRRSRMKVLDKPGDLVPDDELLAELDKLK